MQMKLRLNKEVFKSFPIKIKEVVGTKQFEIFIGIILLVGIVLRISNVSLFPKLSSSEMIFVENAGELIKNSWHLDPKFAPNSLYLYLLAGVGYLFDFNILALRVFQVSLSSIVLLFFYFFVKSWYNRQTAIFAGLFFAINSFLVINSQLIDSKILIPLFIFLIFFVLSIAFRRKSKILFALSGILAGIGLYTDTIFLFMFVLLFCLIIVNVKKNTKFISAYLSEIILFAFTFLLTIAPYIYYLPNFVDSIIKKFNPGSFGQFYLNLGESIPALFYRSPKTTIFNVGIEPIIDPFIAISFLCGITFTLFHLNKRKHVFLIAWLFLGLTMLGFLGINNLLNFYIILPPVIIFASIIFDYILTNWSRTFPFNRQARISMALIFSVFLFMSFFYNYRYQFFAWRNDKTIKNQFNQIYIYDKNN